jgi:hypothetical protein
MKKIILFTIILFCFVHLLHAQQPENAQDSTAMNMLTKCTWEITDTQFGSIQLTFAKNLTYTVHIKSNNMNIKGIFSLKNDLLTFETDDANCGTKGVYTVTFAKETLTIALIQDLCDNRKASVVGVWEALINNP